MKTPTFYDTAVATHTTHNATHIPVYDYHITIGISKYYISTKLVYQLLLFTYMHTYLLYMHKLIYFKLDIFKTLYFSVKTMLQIIVY